MIVDISVIVTHILSLICFSLLGFLCVSMFDALLSLGASVL